MRVWPVTEILHHNRSNLLPTNSLFSCVYINLVRRHIVPLSQIFQNNRTNRTVNSKSSGDVPEGKKSLEGHRHRHLCISSLLLTVAHIPNIDIFLPTMLS